MKKQGKPLLIRWFLNFIKTDLTKLTSGEHSKLVTELNFVLMGYQPDSKERFDDIKDMLVPGLESSVTENRLSQEEKLPMLQSSLKVFFGVIAKQIDAARKSEKEWTPTKLRLLRGLIFYATYPSDIKLTVRTGLMSLDMKDRKDWDGKDDKNKVFRWKAGEVDNARIEIAYTAPVEADTLFFYFCQCLEGIPLGTLHRCEECSSWFYNDSKRDKIYCSNRCSARFNTRRSRANIKKKDPDKHEKRGAENRERAHQHYKKKVEKNIPGAKVKRRPRKK